MAEDDGEEDRPVERHRSWQQEGRPQASPPRPVRIAAADDDDEGEEDRPIPPARKASRKPRNPSRPHKPSTRKAPRKPRTPSRPHNPLPSSPILYHPSPHPHVPDESTFEINLANLCTRPLISRSTLSGIRLQGLRVCDALASWRYAASPRKRLWHDLKALVSQRLTRDLFRVDQPLVLADARDLAYIFDAFDRVYFQGTLWNLMCQQGGASVVFRITNREDDEHVKLKYAGFCQRRPGACVYEFKIMMPIYRQLFISPGTLHYIANGVPCHSRLDCFLHICAHELIHLITFHFCPERGEPEGGHGPLFRQIAYNLFGYTSHFHNLLDTHSNRSPVAAWDATREPTQPYLIE